MNDTLFAIEGLNKTTNVMGQFMDCSGLQLQFCDSMTSGMDQAIVLMGFGLLIQIMRRSLNWIGERWTPFLPISNYVNVSLMPELLILISFIFIAYLRITGM